MVPIPTSNDSLFDSVTGPLANFSSKIDMAFRLGLISGKFTRDLHIVRKIRNYFAHDIYGCSFENGSVMSRIRELENSFNKDWLNVQYTIERKDDLFKGIRGKFIYLTGCMILFLTDLIEKTEKLKVADSEWFYNQPEK